VNPAARPYELLANMLGEHDHPYTREVYQLTELHMHQLEQLAVSGNDVKDLLWLLSQTGDEVLDFNQAVLDYKGAKQTVECGGDHSFQGFERYCSAIVDFIRR
jgi:predicted esterase YcpF (UPF0227 family)